MSPGLPPHHHRYPFTATASTSPHTYQHPINNQSFRAFSHSQPPYPPQLQNVNPIPLPPNTSNPSPLYFSRWNRKIVQNATNNNQLISLYVANLPPRWLPTDIYLVMSKYGEVMEVFAPKNLNRKGKKYAFVRFNTSVEEQFLLQRINSMQIDGEKLVASFAKNRSTGPTNNKRSYAQPFTMPPPVIQGHPHRHKSFVDALHALDRNMSCVAPASEPGAGKADSSSKNSCSSFIPKDPASACLQRCSFGVLKAPMPFSQALKLFTSIESSIEKIIPVGGVSFLITFKTIAEMNFSVNNHSNEWLQFFTSFKPWSEGDAAVNRLCWVLVLSIKIDSHQYEVGIFESQYDPLDWELSNPSGATGAMESPAFARDCSDDRANQSGSPCFGGSSSNSSHSTQPLPSHAQYCFNDSPISEDPFLLRPIIEKIDPNVEPTQLSHPAQLSKSIPSELSEYEESPLSADPTTSLVPTKSSTFNPSPSGPVAPSQPAPPTSPPSMLSSNHRPILNNPPILPLIPYPNSPSIIDSLVCGPTPSPYRPVFIQNIDSS
ncbi:hypothetical protein Tsubulata_008482 [Turnera subulata]|uniref:RRM domain-containing protein n=1 Tax=Turnera subulata TaxID=218843 RepID=A0A9Q0JD50_9ROSI|nr:hypothetical protein Tsubulata_008482 [Turnera subulata]